MPDMLSFGRGLIENPEELLMPISEEYTTGLMPELIDACGGYALPWAFGGYAVFADSELAAKHGLGENISDLPQFLNKLGGPAKYGKTTRDIYALGISNTVKSVPGSVSGPPAGTGQPQRAVCSALQSGGYYRKHLGQL